MNRLPSLVTASITLSLFTSFVLPSSQAHKPLVSPGSIASLVNTTITDSTGPADAMSPGRSIAPVSQGGSILGQVYLRDQANEEDTLLLTIGNTNGLSGAGSNALRIDRLLLTLPKEIKLALGHAPEGWEFSQNKKTLTLNGPPLNIINARFDAAEATDDLLSLFEKKKIEVDALSNGKRVAEFNLDVNIFEPRALPAEFGEVVTLPNQVSPGETFLATVNDSFLPKIKVSDNAGAPPAERTFLQYNYYNHGTWRIRIEGSGEWEDLPPEHKIEISGSAAQAPPGRPVASAADLTDEFLYFVVPQGAQPNNSVHFTFVDPWGQTAAQGSGPQTEIVPPEDSSCPATIEGATSHVFAGRTVCICACVADPTTWFQMSLDGAPIKPAAASSHTITLRVPETATPGKHSVTFNSNVKNGSGKAEFLVLKLTGRIDSQAILRGESTIMRLQIQGTKEKMPLEIENKTTGIITIDGIVKNVVDTSGGAANVIERRVTGKSPGNFRIDYKLALPACPCSAERPNNIAARRDEKPGCTDEVGPEVFVESPAPDATVIINSVNVRFRAKDPSGIASATVNGTAATESYPGNYTATISVPSNEERGTPTKATITVIVRDTCRGITTVTLQINVSVK